MILRLYGMGRVALPGGGEWNELLGHFAWQAGDGRDRGDRRGIIVVELDRICDSCGYAVPQMGLRGERDLRSRWSEKKTPDGLESYRAEHNASSIDGLPALS